MKKTGVSQEELGELLNELHDRYNRIEFIENDPIAIPHSFTKKEDVEIAGFLTAAIAWGQRPQIIKSANWLMDLMDRAPYDFIAGASDLDLERLSRYYYRTFKPVDALFFIRVLKKIYADGGLQQLFSGDYIPGNGLKTGLLRLYSYFNGVPHEQRSMKHIANVQKGASAKRMNMFLRWMVRDDKRGVDFGLWKNLSASDLFIPLDVHVANSARALGILDRKQSDWKAVEQLTKTLKEFDQTDPVRFDYALFGAGIEGVLPR